MSRVAATLRAPLTTRRALLLVLTAAVLARLPLALAEWALYPDEIWQYLEPAYRLGFGRAAIAWEYRAGLRGWLIPTLLAAPMAGGVRLLAATPFPFAPLRLLLVAASLVPVATAFALGRRLSPVHALAAGLAVALAFEPVLMAARAMSEPIGAALLAGALLLLLPGEPGGPGRARRWAAGGACAGLALASRLQMAPAIGVLVLLCCGRDWRKWAAAAAGGLLALAAAGLCDLAQGAVPLGWTVQNYRVNLVQRVSEHWGVLPPGWYVGELLRLGGPLWPPLLLLVLLGARRQPIVLAVALAHLAAHMAIPHKEYRFIYPTVLLLTLLAGLGAGEVLAWVGARRLAWRWPAAGTLLLALVAADAIGARAAVRDHRFQLLSQIAMWRGLHARPGMCGIGYLDTGETVPYALANAASYIDRPVPIYAFVEADRARALAARRAAFNVVEAGSRAAPALTPLGYRLDRCFESRSERAAGPAAPRALCLFARVGGCAPAGAEHYLDNAVRARRGV